MYLDIALITSCIRHRHGWTVHIVTICDRKVASGFDGADGGEGTESAVNVEKSLRIES